MERENIRIVRVPPAVAVRGNGRGQPVGADQALELANYECAALRQQLAEASDELRARRAGQGTFANLISCLAYMLEERTDEDAHAGIVVPRELIDRVTGAVNVTIKEQGDDVVLYIRPRAEEPGVEL